MIPILILKIRDFQLPPKSDSFFVQLVLRNRINEAISKMYRAYRVDKKIPKETDT